MTLVAGVEQRWEEAEFSALYSATAPVVRSFVRQRAGDVNLVEDLVQETFLRAYRSPPDCDRPPLPWLLTIARHVCIDAFRRQRPCQLVTPDLLPDDATDEEDPHRRFARGLQRDAIGKVLSAMPERQQRVLVSKALLGRSATEIATDEGMSVDGVKSLAARARRSFSDAYATLAEQRGLVVLPALWWRLRARIRSVLAEDLASGSGIRSVLAEDLASGSGMAGASPAFFKAIAALAVAGALAVGGSDATDEVGAPTPLERPSAVATSQADADVPFGIPDEFDLPTPASAPGPAEVPPPPSPPAPGGVAKPTAERSVPEAAREQQVRVDAPLPEETPADLVGQGTITIDPEQTSINAHVEDRIGGGGGTTSNVVEVYCEPSVIAGMACDALEAAPG